jgi:hypothetical protein
MTTIRHATIFTLLATILTVSVVLSQVSHETTATPRNYQNKNFTFGAISSIQNDESGKPDWIITGHWKTDLLSENASSIYTLRTSQFNVLLCDHCLSQNRLTMSIN